LSALVSIIAHYSLVNVFSDMGGSAKWSKFMHL